MATKKAAKNKIFLQLDKVKAQAGNLSDEAIQATDNLVDFSLQTGKQWQGVFAKALQNGTILFGKQQELMLDTLEGLKDQYLRGNRRMKKLLKFKAPIKPLETPLLSKIKAQRAIATKAVKTTVAKAQKTTGISRRKKASSKSDILQQDLKIIKGIGPKIEALLNQAGITTFEQLAVADLKTIRAVLDMAGPRYKKLDPNDWRRQAKMAAKN